MSGKPTVRAGIVGAGFAASFHYEALRKVTCANVEIQGVWSPNRARDFAHQRDIPATGSLEELIGKCDVLHVCTTVDSHEAVAVKILEADKFAIVEKPLTGFFGGEGGLNQFDNETLINIMTAERRGKGRILYAENWVYAPAIQKEREIIEKTGAQILWIHGEQAHSGSHARSYGEWKSSGGGVMLSKGCHPLTAALYLKAVEGRARDGRPIRPASVTARTHELTRLPGFRDEGHLRADYVDIDDFSMMHVTFEDGTVATIFASDIILGGVHNRLEVAANNHRTICNINPNTAMQTYNPVEANFRDVYVVEKTGTKQGWSFVSPDEAWFSGIQQEIEAFYRSVAFGDPVESDSRLAYNAISTIWSAYVSAGNAGRAVNINVI